MTTSAMACTSPNLGGTVTIDGSMSLFGDTSNLGPGSWLTHQGLQLELKAARLSLSTSCGTKLIF